MGYSPAWILSFAAFIFLYFFLGVHGALSIMAMLAVFFIMMCLCHKFLNNKWRWW